MGVQFVGLEMLTADQQALLKEYGFWASVLVMSPEDFDYQEAFVVIEKRLHEMEIYPSYDEDFSVCTYVRG
jgi:hypothetical protein